MSLELHLVVISSCTMFGTIRKHSGVHRYNRTSLYVEEIVEYIW